VHYLSEEHVFIFLLQLFSLLLAAKILGELCRRRGIPPLTGEIAAGVLLGPTVLGRAWPAAYAFLFPQAAVQQYMLETVSWIGVLFLLLITGFEVNVSAVWKEGRSSVIVGVVGVLVPVIIGCAVFWWFPEVLRGPRATRVSFTLFLAVAASISAITVIARVLLDLEILKSDFGLVTLSAFVVNDILGWLLFTIVIGIALQTGTGFGRVLMLLGGIVVFGAVCLTAGSRLVDRTIDFMNRFAVPQPAGMLALVSLTALGCGIVTRMIGLHAILGFFIAGIMAGNAARVTERSREIISQMIYAVFVPVFFASIGVKLDFVSNMNVTVTLVFTAVAVGGKFLGALLGARLAGFSPLEAVTTGIAFVPGGAMEIILGIFALEVGIISESVFVAVVFAALLSSIVTGPLLAWVLRFRKEEDVGRFLREEGVVPLLAGAERFEVIRELCTALGARMKNGMTERIAEAVAAREKVMGTGIGNEAAVPHARLKEIAEPVIAFGYSRKGIEWDSFDGKPVHFVFCILTPDEDVEGQMRIMAAVAECVKSGAVKSAVEKAESRRELYAALQGILTASSSAAWGKTGDGKEPRQA